MDDPISDGMNAAANLLNTDQGRNLLNPVTQEIGLLLADLVGAFRFCVEENWARFYPKWARQRHNRPLTLDEIRKVVPLLQAASLCSDDELQERWAALLETSVSTPEGVLPSFGQTLSQMTSDEAKYLECIYLDAVAKNAQGSFFVGSVDTMFDIFDPEFRLFYGERCEEMESQLESRTNYVKLVLADLVRLGILVCDRKTVKRKGVSEQNVEIKAFYAVSAYGVSFIKAVTPKR